MGPLTILICSYWTTGDFQRGQEPIWAGRDHGRQFRILLYKRSNYRTFERAKLDIFPPSEVKKTSASYPPQARMPPTQSELELQPGESIILFETLPADSNLGEASTETRDVLELILKAENCTYLDDILSSILERREHLNIHGSVDYNLISPLYTQMIFGKTPYSHNALHALRVLQLDDNFPEEGRQQIQTFFEWQSKDIAEYWKVFEDFKHVSVSIDQDTLPDPASFSAWACSDCFMWLLQQGIIQPGGFNRVGQSFFSLACHEGQFDLARQLIMKMTPLQILQPTTVTHTCTPDTVLKASSRHEELLLACLDQIERQGDLDIQSILEDQDYSHICHYADAKLAIRLFAHGINLSDMVRGSPITWAHMAEHHPNPLPLFDWLLSFGCWPSSTRDPVTSPLLIAAQNDKIEIASWLLNNTFDWKEREICAINATTRQTDPSVSILDLTLQHIRLLDLPRLPSDWPQELFTKTIQEACNEKISDELERLAIQKLNILQKYSQSTLISDKKILRELNGLKLSHLSSFAGDQNAKALQEIGSDSRFIGTLSEGN